jgi:uncharacterized membrane protein YdjX (TVP38/TMEM64 family)
MKLLNHKHKITLIKVSIFISLLAIIFGSLYFIITETIPDLIPILKSGSEKQIEEYIRSTGPKGIFFTSLFQILQVITVFFPGLPIHVTAGIIYGTFGGYLICHLSYIFANFVVFKVVRKLGNRINDLLPKESNSPRFSFIRDSQYSGFMIFLTCLIPLIPNGFIPYIAAKTKISSKDFIVSVACGSMPCIFIFAAIGNRILLGDFVLVAIICIIFAVVLILLLIFKDKIIEKALAVRAKFLR